MWESPIWIYLLLYGYPNCSVQLTRVPSAQLHLDNYFPKGLPEDFLMFLCEHGSCKHCDLSITNSFLACKCGLEEDDAVFLNIKFPQILYSEYVKPFLDAEQAKLRRERRRGWLASAGGKHTAAQIRDLCSIQQSRCYYCLELFKRQSGRLAFQKDHLVAASLGGGDDISNIVLACASCNRAKSDASFETFDRGVCKLLDAQKLDVRCEIRLARRRWLDTNDG